MEAPGGTRLGSTVVVGLDFGTTFSGYAYCHKEDLAKIYMFYEWPEQASGGGQAYCKTQTSLFYAPDAQGKLQYKSYGWPASVEYHKAMSSAAKSSHNFDPLKVGHLVTLFKLTLAPCYDDSSQASNHRLPSGLTTATVITDFLREISKSIMRELKTRYGEQFTMREVQWCLTVPALWDDHAKQLMKSYAEEAGLVVSRYSPCASSDASPYPLQIVLEPEAAAVYCLSKTMKHLTIGEHDMFLTVDIGGGTVDIVVHKKVQSSTSNSQLEVRNALSSDVLEKAHVCMR
jgi:molecular chaperone DnaK (HSP70)